jgi:hypothetical protein
MKSAPFLALNKTLKGLDSPVKSSDFKLPLNFTLKKVGFFKCLFFNHKHIHVCTELGCTYFFYRRSSLKTNENKNMVRVLWTLDSSIHTTSTRDTYMRKQFEV